MKIDENSPIYASLKSMDTEEWIDLAFYRPLGYWWAKFFDRLDVSPNTVTILSIFLGVGAGLLFYQDSFWLNLLGVFLLIWANTYDSADGQLARMSGKKSELGRILDGLSGDLWFVTIYLAIAFRLYPQWGLWIFLLGLAAGLCHRMQAAMADYYRNIHLFFLKGKSGSELDNYPQQQALYDSMSWKTDFLRKLFQFFYKDYTLSQEHNTPAFQRLFAKVNEIWQGGVSSEAFRSAFRSRSLPLMKYTNILSFNTRAIALCVSILIGLPWLYFCFELLALTPLYFYMHARHEGFSKELTALLEKGQFQD